MINIFLTSDENYAKYMAVTIQSILTHTTHPISFYILNGGIEKDTQNKLKTLIDGTEHKLEFCSIDMSLFQDCPNIRHFSLNAYFRYLIPIVKPNIDRALYLDTDTVICGDIYDLYQMDLGENPIAAVPHMEENMCPTMYKKYKALMGYPPTHRYFNSGVLLLDCKKLRQMNATQILFKKTAEIQDKITMADQDVFNAIFANAYTPLPDQYNLVVDVLIRFFNFSQYIQKISGCYILHYTGGTGCRPWISKCVPGAEIFWKHARCTPFYADLQFDLLTNQMNAVLQKINHDFPPKIIKTVRLCDFLPILSISIKNNKKKIIFLGIPIITITQKIKNNHKITS